LLREFGAQNGCIVAAASLTQADEAGAVARARAAPFESDIRGVS
jgi:hypothetical protein